KVEELLGKPWLDLVAPPFREHAARELQARRRGELGEYETILLRRDSSLLPVLIRAQPFFLAGEYRGSLKAFADVSRLKEFETRYRYFAEQTEEGFFRLVAKEPVDLNLPAEKQVQQLYQSFVLVEANSAFAKAYGYPQVENLLHRSVAEIFGKPEIPEDFRALLLEFVENGYRLAQRELLVSLPSGEARWISYTAIGLLEEGKLREVWGTQRDVTARRKGEEELSRQVQRLTILHDLSQELLSVQDPEEIFAAVHRAVAELMPAEAFVIALKRSEEEAEAVYLYDKGGRFPPAKVPKGQGLTWYVLGEARSVYVRDLAAEGVPAIHFGSEEPVRSVLAVPLRVGQRVIGMIST
ncbi:MAG: PAS domain-containing protein, partial [Candidatus Bipolaricaulaceae bacterium]